MHERSRHITEVMTTTNSIMDDLVYVESSGSHSVKTNLPEVTWTKYGEKTMTISKDKHVHDFDKASGNCRKCGMHMLHAQGVKFDEDKLPYHLIAPEFLSAVAEILQYGAKKYSPRNWENGMAWHRPFRACLGHLWDWWRRAGPDPETGKSHLWHAACCIMFLIVYEARNLGEDDRPM